MSYSFGSTLNVLVFSTENLSHKVVLTQSVNNFARRTSSKETKERANFSVAVKLTLGITLRIYRGNVLARLYDF